MWEGQSRPLNSCLMWQGPLSLECSFPLWKWEWQFSSYRVLWGSDQNLWIWGTQPNSQHGYGYCLDTQAKSAVFRGIWVILSLEQFSFVDHMARNIWDNPTFVIPPCSSLKYADACLSTYLDWETHHWYYVRARKLHARHSCYLSVVFQMSAHFLTQGLEVWGTPGMLI